MGEPRTSKPLSPEATSRLVESYQKFLAFVERRVSSRAVAEDILQAAFVSGLKAGADVSDENVLTWFYRVLRNAIIDHYRRQDASARMLDAWGQDFEESREPEVELKKEICSCVLGLLETLKPEYRVALQTIDMEDGKLRDLASKTGITDENAAVRVHRARKALRQQLQTACGSCAQHGCLDCDCQHNDRTRHAAEVRVRNHK